MEYNTYTPSEHLSRYIRCYWVLEDGPEPVPPARERIFPDGCMEWLFHYGDRFKKFDGDSFVIQPRCFVHGQLKQFMEVEATGRTGVFSVRFQPQGVRPFISCEADTLTERVADVSELWGTAGVRLSEAMLAAESAEERIRLVEDFLWARLDESVDKTGTVSRCVEQIGEHAGMVSVERLAEDACLGRRQLERRFLQQVGLTPKLFARIIRFNHVLRLIEAKAENNLAHLAQEGGFYDQAHFIKDFKDFTGLNPGAYFSEELDLVRFFNLEK